VDGVFLHKVPFHVIWSEELDEQGLGQHCEVFIVVFPFVCGGWSGEHVGGGVYLARNVLDADVVVL